MSIFKTILSIITIIIIISIFMSFSIRKKTERQSYRLVKQFDDFEIRYYPKSIMATVTSNTETYMDNSNSNFRRLAGYIFGNNNREDKISMTAPVHMQKKGNKNEMSFVMPSQYKMEQLPTPRDSSIKLHYSEEGYYAAIKFGGYANNRIIENKEEQLKKLIEQKGYEIIGLFHFLGYNAPWDFLNRENEILVKITFQEE
jgi:hypothetical protein